MYVLFDNDRFIRIINDNEIEDYQVNSRYMLYKVDVELNCSHVNISFLHRLKFLFTGKF